MAGAIIESIRFTATHDGELALAARLRFPEGGISQVQISGKDVARVMQQAGVASAEQLVGKPWSVLRLPSGPAGS